MKRWCISSGHWTRSCKLRSTTQAKKRTYAALAQQTTQETAPSITQLTTPKVDPFTLVSHDLVKIQSNLLELMGSAHPKLREMAEFYFLRPSRQLRPLVILLMSRATNGLGNSWNTKCWEALKAKEAGLSEEYDRPLTQSGVLESWDPTMPNDRESFQDLFSLRQPHSLRSSSIPHDSSPPPFPPPTLLPTQLRLAQIVEMINLASILHQSIPNSNKETPGRCEKNTKLSILGGDFLLGRASSALSRLGEAEVVELIASVISNISEGELLELPAISMPQTGSVEFPQDVGAAWDLYLKRTYMKTASLIAKGARSAAILGGSSNDDPGRDIAYYYGRHLGTAYQLMQDIIDLNDNLNSRIHRLPTAPLLFAWEAFPDVGPLLRRNLSDGDVDMIQIYLQESSAVERTKALAYRYAHRAQTVLNLLPDSQDKLALTALTRLVVDQNW